jgi:uncharacterized protein (DUF433 family)
MSAAADNPLSQGFYTVAEAARLIRVGSRQRIYGWLKGYPRRGAGPLLARDYEPVGGVEELSFLDLMEVRFVEHFREHGVKMRSLRRASARLRQEWNTTHPFALQRVHVIADKADIFVEEVLRDSAEQEHDPRLRSLLTENYVMYEAIKQNLLPGVTFDSKSHLAETWAPRAIEFPAIKINPRVAFGQPATPSGVPTITLYNAWKAEKQNADEVAYWYDLPSTEVLEAIRFEELLDRRSEVQAA